MMFLPTSLTLPDTTAAHHDRDSFIYPDKSLLNHARVDFSRFLPLTAKIDCLTFLCKPADLTPASLQALRQQVKQGTLEAPKDRRKINEHGEAWITIHDPSLRDLRVLVERFWNSRVTYIEFAVDAKLPTGSNDLHLLEELKAQLRHCLKPQEHGRLHGSKRKYFDVPLKKYRADGLGTNMPSTQILYEKAGVDDQFALYIKTLDAHHNISQPWVRMEARLEGSGCSKAGLHKLGMLPAFAPSLRSYLSPMFSVGCGYKNAAELKGRGISRDPWSGYGAQWNGLGIATIEPDAEANRAIGSALNELRKSLMNVKQPSSISISYEDWVYEQSP